MWLEKTHTLGRVRLWASQWVGCGPLRWPSQAPRVPSSRLPASRALRYAHGGGGVSSTHLLLTPRPCDLRLPLGRGVPSPSIRCLPLVSHTSLYAITGGTSYRRNHHSWPSLCHLLPTHFLLFPRQLPPRVWLKTSSR
ncbi:hypothetical protein BU14_0208s0009 [Porphyra umbilicalis]|uniref:Uncharacterized protein n=1 Tax=Porphyra umbilicalis TaxID=2786 RepID=A0A1X6P591_PORUM|nr:hypothetical protein BU14_0208s0009 [Porphyra umbilicalis]|eukprot:OSX76051.1 hypothetical protein BU14_0208s0009 [Porphyra umbilicalis]